MNDFQRHLETLLADILRSHRVVTWYDPRREFQSFIAELCRGQLPPACGPHSISLSSLPVHLCLLQESFFEVKFAVEPLVSADLPELVLIYLPGKPRHDETAVLMELEAGGERWEPQLKREARRVLKKHYGDGQIDQMLSSPSLTYPDIVSLLDNGGNRTGSGSLLDLIFPDVKGNNAGLLAAWLTTDQKDREIHDKGAVSELYQLIDSRVGLECAATASLADIRRSVCRYVLIAEFRNDLQSPPPDSLALISQPSAKQLALVLDVARSMRQRHPAEYVGIADGIEQELRLATQALAPAMLGRIDTFRFEEQMLLEHVAGLIMAGTFAAAVEVIRHRRHSFWALHQLRRQEQWQAYGLAAELGIVIEEVRQQLPDAKHTVAHWVEGYVTPDGWYRADLLHRRLESTLAAMTDTIACEKVVHRIRQDYETLVGSMTSSFMAAFREAGWTIPGVLHQTEIYSRELQPASEPICYILVDALRYEMGVELSGLLESAEELTLQAAVAAIPTITPVGMAALMPGAEQSFSVVDCGREVGGRINDSVLASLNDRRKFWKGRVPDVVDLELDKVLSHSNTQLQNRIAGAPLLIVRSVEIDAMGEGGSTLLARQVVDTAINNVARAIRRLAGLGISRFVVAADHGHLFINERDESERIEKPGGEQVSLHRRCWAGRGGATPKSTVRVSAPQLGYQSDLDFVFPTGNFVFRAGGDLAYHHGGLSLQELLVPVLSVRMPAVVKSQQSDISVSLGKVPEKIANRIVTFSIASGKSLFQSDEFSIRPVLLSNGQHVGHVGMVMDATHDPLTHCVRMKPGSSCMVAIQLVRDDVENVEIVILDPAADRVLAKSNKIPVRLGF